MGDAAFMRPGQCRSGLDTNVEYLGQRRGAATEQGSQRFALDQLHDLKRSVLELAGVGYDVGMIQRRGGSSLLRKAPRAFRMAAELRSQHVATSRPRVEPCAR